MRELEGGIARVGAGEKALLKLAREVELVDELPVSTIEPSEGLFEVLGLLLQELVCRCELEGALLGHSHAYVL